MLDNAFQLTARIEQDRLTYENNVNSSGLEGYNIGIGFTVDF